MRASTPFGGGEYRAPLLEECPRVRPRALDGSWRPNSRMLKNTPIGGVSMKL